MTRRALPFVLAATAVVATAACDKILGLDKYVDGVCVPGDTPPDDCVYSGPEGTVNVGICKAPVRVCENGQWSECKKQVIPEPEDCATDADDNCNGEVNEASAGCCKPGSTRACYTGPAGTEDKGACQAGTEACGMDGKTYEPCSGQTLPTQETCASTDDEDCDDSECVEWTHLYGDASDQLVQDFTADAAGNMYVVGMLYGTLDINGSTLTANGSGDGYLLKLDPTGNGVWGVSFGNNSLQEVDAVAVDSMGNVFIGGRGMGSAFNLGGSMIPPGLFLAKYAPDGTLLWSKGLTTTTGCVGSDSNLRSLAVTPNDELLVAGYYCGTIDFGDGPVSSNGRDAFVAKLRNSDGSGKVSDGFWSRVFGDSMLQSADHVAAEKSGNIYVGCKYQGSMNFGLGQVGPASGADAMLIKFDPKGQPIWYQGIKGGGDQSVSSLTVDSSGGIIVTGTFDTEIDFFGVSTPSSGTGTNGYMVRYGGDHSFSWSKTFPSALVAASAGTKGDIMVSGLFVGSIDLGDGPLQATGTGFELILAKLGNSGTVKWKRGFGDTKILFDLAAKAILLPNGESLLGGSIVTPVSFGGGTITPAGGADAFVAKFGI